MTSRELRRRSRYCISETSPPMPTIDLELKGWRRLTSVKRAREPYDAAHDCQLQRMSLGFLNMMMTLTYLDYQQQ